MVLKRIGVVSSGKLSGVFYALIGLIIGAILSLVSLLGMAFGAMSESPLGALGGLLFGLAAIIAMPVLYGIIGFIAGLAMAALYNLVAGITGGLEIELQ